MRGEKILSALEDAVERYQNLEPEDRERIVSGPLRFIVSAGTHSHWIGQCGRYADGLAWGQAFLDQAAPPRTPAENLEHGAAYFGLGICHAGLGHPEQAMSAFRSTRALFAENIHLLSVAMDWELELALIEYYPDIPDERRKLLDETDELWQTSYGQRLPTIADILEGRWAEARAAVAATVNVESLRAFNARFLAELDRLQGHWSRSWLQISGIMPEGPAIEPGTRLYCNQLHLQETAAELALDEGRLDLASDWIATLQRWRDWSGQVPRRATPALLRARLHEQQGRLDAARHDAQQALELADHPRQPLAIMAARRALGRLEARAGRHQTAEQHLTEALAIAQACGAPYETALVQVEQARLFATTGSVQEAARALTAAANTAWRLEAKPLLDRIAAIEREQNTGLALSRRPAGLSAREMEVLRLAAQGLSDAAIGERLYISRRTVSGHFQTIFNRLDIHSRTAAVAFAYEHGII